MKNVTIVLRGHEWPSIRKITLIITHEPTQKTATFPIIRFTNVTTKNDISWQFIWFFVDNSWKLGLGKNFFLSRIGIFQFTLCFQFPDKYE